MNPTLPASIVPSENVLVQELGGEAFLLNLDNEKYYQLCAVGTRIWELLAEHEAPQKVLAQMELEFDASAEELSQDMDELIADFLKHGLVQKG